MLSWWAEKGVCERTGDCSATWRWGSVVRNQPRHRLTTGCTKFQLSTSRAGVTLKLCSELVERLLVTAANLLFIVWARVYLMTGLLSLRLKGIPQHGPLLWTFLQQSSNIQTAYAQHLFSWCLTSSNMHLIFAILRLFRHKNLMTSSWSSA